MGESVPRNRAERRAAEQKRRRLAKKAAMGGGAALTLGASIIGGAQPASADTFTVDSTADDNGIGTTLREAIALANANTGFDTITFDPTVFAAAETILLNPLYGQLEITDPVRIVGTGADNLTVDADGNSRVFYLYVNSLVSGTTTISGMTITDGYAQYIANPAPPYTIYDSGDGGGILVESGRLTVSEVVVYDNVADNDGGGIAASYGTTITVQSSTVSGNLAGDDGGGLYTDNNGVVTIDDSYFNDNLAYADGGGAWFNDVASTVTVTDSSFYSNTARSNGGGFGAVDVNAQVAVLATEITYNVTYYGDGGGAFFYDVYSPILVSYDNFHQNYAGTNNYDAHGGGIVVDGAYAPAMIEYSSFTYNNASEDGGAVFINDSSSETRIEHNYIANNDAYSSGGGIFLYNLTGDSTTRIDDTHIAGNYAHDGDGGGVQIYNVDGAVTITDSTISSNYAYSDGGGLNAKSVNAPLTIEGSQVNDNHAHYGAGGGIRLYDLTYKAPVTIDGSTISGNRSRRDDGGALRIQTADAAVRITGGTLEHNSAYSDGGAISTYDVNDSLTILDTTVYDNSADLGDGGGINILSHARGAITIEGSYIEGNYAYSEGGGIRLYNTDYNSPVTLTDTTVSGNHAENSFGGGLRIASADSVVQISGGHFDKNESYDDGGGISIYAVNDALTIDGATVYDNYSDYGDGVGIDVRNVQGAVTVEHSYIESNYAHNGNGGGLHFYNLSYNAPLTIHDTTVSSNVAQFGDGGGIRMENLNAPVRITEGTLEHNDAYDDGGAISLYNIDEALTVQYTTLYDNDVESGSGGAIKGENLGGAVTIEHSSIEGNYAYNDGGGVMLYNLGGYAPLTVHDTTISGNEAGDGGGDGGGLRVESADASIRITDSYVNGNTAYSDGGGVQLDGVYASVSILGTTIYDNTADYGGGLQWHNENNGGNGHSGEAHLIMGGSRVNENTATSGEGGGIAMLTVRGDISILGSEITGNDAGGLGGGIYVGNDGRYSHVTLAGVDVSDNTSARNGGGGMVLDQVYSVRILDSTFDSNASNSEYANATLYGGDGGGILIYNVAEDVVIDHTTISRNTVADGEGGGVWANYVGGAFEVVDSTISTNSAGANGVGDGGGLMLGQIGVGVSVRNSTIVDNYSGHLGGGIFTNAYATLDHTIVANNEAYLVGDDLYGSPNFSMFFSLVEDPYDANYTDETPGFNILGTDPALGPLQDNGGPNETHLPTAASPVIDAGDPTFTPPPTTDQRFEEREVDTIDIGAVERQPDDVDGGGGGGGGGGGVPTPPDNVIRIAGDDRILTAIEVSEDSFANADSATAGVLARSDAFPDALAATPLAVEKVAPLLLTATASLDSRTEAELLRVLPDGATVYLVGGTTALSPAVATRLQSLGFTVVRYAGTNRFETAVAVADQGLANPSRQFLATGLNFPDALAGGAAAAANDGAILLTNGTSPHPATTAYLTAHPVGDRYCLGGPACTAHPGTLQLAGADRYETAVLVAKQLFTAPTNVGVATGEGFADALAGGAHIGRKNGPLLLTPTDSLIASTQEYLEDNDISIAVVYIYGGTAAVSQTVHDAIEAIID